MAWRITTSQELPNRRDIGTATHEASLSEAQREQRCGRQSRWQLHHRGRRMAVFLGAQAQMTNWPGAGIVAQWTDVSRPSLRFIRNGVFPFIPYPKLGPRLLQNVQKGV